MFTQISSSLMPVMRIVRATGILYPASSALRIWLRRPTVMNFPVRNCSAGMVSMSKTSGWLTSASRSFCTSTPFMQNISVGGCMPPSASPLRHSTPARQATSPSPVQSMTVLARIASRPALLSMTTPSTASPFLTTSAQNTYNSTSTPTSCSISSATVFASSGSMIVRLTWSLQGRCSPAAPRARRRSMKSWGSPLIIWLPLRPR